MILNHIISFDSCHNLFGCYVNVNNISNKIHSKFDPYIRNEWVILFIIIFWILTLYKFFYPYINVNNKIIIHNNILDIKFF